MASCPRSASEGKKKNKKKQKKKKQCAQEKRSKKYVGTRSASASSTLSQGEPTTVTEALVRLATPNNGMEPEPETFCSVLEVGRRPSNAGEATLPEQDTRRCLPTPSHTPDQTRSRLMRDLEDERRHLVAERTEVRVHAAAQAAQRRTIDAERTTMAEERRIFEAERAQFRRAVQQHAASVMAQALPVVEAVAVTVSVAAGSGAVDCSTTAACERDGSFPALPTLLRVDEFEDDLAFRVMHRFLAYVNCEQYGSMLERELMGFESLLLCEDSVRLGCNPDPLTVYYYYNTCIPCWETYNFIEMYCTCVHVRSPQTQ